MCHLFSIVTGTQNLTVNFTTVRKHTTFQIEDFNASGTLIFK